MAVITAQIDRGIELLTLCQELQSEKDGIVRTEPFKIGPNKTDDFARDIETACVNMAALRKLVPMSETLAKIGRKLHQAGTIHVEAGDSYAEKTLEYFAAKFQD